MILNVMFSLSLVQALKTMPNRVTTLEVRRDNINTAVGLQDFLCNSPHLLHLIAPNTELSIHHLDIHQRLPIQWIRVDDNNDSNGRRRPVSQIWACRNLRTLRLAFHSYGSGRIEVPMISRLIFGYISEVCPHVQDLEINEPEVSSLESRTYKPTLCMRLEGGMCLLAHLRQLRRLRVGSFDAELECTPTDVDWMVPSGHTWTARMARRRTIVGWDSNLAKEQQEDLCRLSNPNKAFLVDSTSRPSVVVTFVDQELESRMKNLGLLAHVKTMLLEKMERGDFEVWPRLTRAGLYTDMDFLLPVENECFRLTKGSIPPPPPKSNRLSKMFSFS
ncbi:hypothetical protein BGZ96_002220 [Linnemannia gamsii]|uniref:F-box domain-containing protein n=1 Tax=Linnemannia gamsii TaxID=64522 RepID=A0ABQ7K8B0_9FUNG|nr:hypothetical protein BGZ96_002220 [Linnemannia gamsii]